MARMPGAQWRPVPNRTFEGQYAVYGVVLHVMEGTLDGTDAWFRNSSSQVSAHFGVGKDGRIFQWVDTADRAWAQVDGNRTWLSIEHEGNSGDSLTLAQLSASARVIAWMHATHGVRLQSTDSPTGRGIGWHGMGGSAWGGHLDCPGTAIRNQRPALIAAAKNGEDMDLTQANLDDIAGAVWSADVIPAARPPHGNDDYATNPTWSAKYAVQAAVEAARAAGEIPLALTDVQVDRIAAALAAAPGLADSIADKVAQNIAARLDN